MDVSLRLNFIYFHHVYRCSWLFQDLCTFQCMLRWLHYMYGIYMAGFHYIWQQNLVSAKFGYHTFSSCTQGSVSVLSRERFCWLLMSPCLIILTPRTKITQLELCVGSQLATSICSNGMRRQAWRKCRAISGCFIARRQAILCHKTFSMFDIGR